MADADIGQMIATLVDNKVNALLAPHLEALSRLHAFFGTSPGKRGPGRPPKAAAALTARAPGRRGPGRPRGTKNAAATDLSKFSEGQMVKYRQGRGEFEAKVLKVDASAGTVLVQRESDGKKVSRPASKLYGA